MWDKWKDRISNFIWKEVKPDHEENTNKENIDQHHINNHSVQTRVAYKYPNKKPFKFPVIPDEPPKNPTIDTPAYKRREIEKKNQKLSQPEPKLSNDPSISNTNHSNSYSRKVYKKDKDRPFKPSRVPSPIYGYQERRKEKEVHEIPAYIRKDRTSNQNELKENNHQFKEEKEYQQRNQQQMEQVKMPAVASQESEVNSKETGSVIQKNNENNAEVNKKEDINKEAHSNSKSLQRIHKSNTTNSKKRNQKQTNIPFNVIMTPRDKKNQLDKKKEQHSVDNKKNRTTNMFVEQNKEATFPNTLLNEPVVQSSTNDLWVEEQKGLLEETLKHFKVNATVVNATQGPSVTRFEVKPELGVKVSRIRNLSDDLKLNMAAKDIRIEAPIPGKNTVGIEVPNPKAQMVGLQEIFETEEFKKSSSPLTVALGLNIEGSPIITNIQKMPHGLIAGATGSGKSVCINTILISLLYKASHDDVKLILIDPKMVELTQYNGIPHLVSPVITDVKAATAALKWAVNEMEERYEKFVEEGVRNIEKYNQKVIERGDANDKMPFIVIVIDELADLMMVSPQDVEDSISRIAQKARACGIHLLLATQRPSVDVITGLIKANIPTRIAFSVSSQVDSRTIIDVGGAEKLLGKGDMLFVENGAGKSTRLQGAFVSDEEIDRVTNHARKIATPNYLFEQDTLLEKMTHEEEKDELLQDAIDFIMSQDSASTSMLQRHFKIGYNRAARLIDTLERKGIISSQNGSKPRDILVTQTELENIFTS